MVVKVNEVRQKRGITIYELAKRSGIAQSYVWNLDHGKLRNPSLEVLGKLAKALNCAVEDLYDAELKQA